MFAWVIQVAHKPHPLSSPHNYYYIGSVYTRQLLQTKWINKEKAKLKRQPFPKLPDDFKFQNHLVTPVRNKKWRSKHKGTNKYTTTRFQTQKQRYKGIANKHKYWIAPIGMFIKLSHKIEKLRRQKFTG